MSDGTEVQITQLLTQLRDGDAEAADRLMPLIYSDLHARAASIMRGEKRAVTMQPTALVHEAWMRLQRSPGGDWENRRHFLRLAGRVMRNVLVDRARRWQPGGDGLDPDALEIPIGPEDADRVDVLDLQAALERLATRDPELEEIVDMRFFAGLTLQETADALGKSVTGVHRAWELARTFLSRELRNPDG